MSFARSTWLLALGWATETYFNGDAPVFTEVPKVMASERSSEVSDNAVRESKSMDDIFEELDCFLCSSRDERFILNPLGELVNGNTRTENHLVLA